MYTTDATVASTTRLAQYTLTEIVSITLALSVAIVGGIVALSYGGLALTLLVGGVLGYLGGRAVNRGWLVHHRRHRFRTWLTGSEATR